MQPSSLLVPTVALTKSTSSNPLERRTRTRPCSPPSTARPISSSPHLGSLPARSILVGDLNIAPREDDVWNHRQLLKIVSHTPIEVDHLNAVIDAGDWVDVTRADIPSGLLYSWWSYRAADWDAADKGRRLDHVWASRDIANAAHGSRVLRAARGWDGPSDHAPVFASFDL